MVKRLALLIALVGTAVLSLHCPLVTYNEVDDRTVPLSNHTRLRISNMNGTIQLINSQDNAVILHTTKHVTGPNETGCQERIHDISISVIDTGGVVNVVVTQPTTGGAYSYGADVEARLPRSLGTDLTTANGDIAGADLEAACKAVTTNGDVRLTGIEGDVEAKTTNGRIDLERIQGSVTGEGTSGPLEVEAVLPESGFCRLTSTSGNVGLRIPDTTSARLYATTTSGLISYTSLTILGNITPQKIDGRLGDGKGDIRITVTNGDILLTGY